ncbi:TolC family protein [Tenacibaculum sp. IB213877]|uniref:TolC family protein n=1 Tax=Tenacibaculum sp. IB213877 TaxID=3097351 RepID=UPI002A59ACCD|nr:TolC family protein [Tenacibaculum sp. IB213877]MDY0781518.1 TolC family protein [Tenacibaculum sp. IB213877]
MNRITNRIKTYVVLSVLTSLLYACVPSKIIREENKTTPHTFHNKSIDSTNTATIQWKEFFADPNLISLIDNALANNQELNIILQQIDIAKNEIKIRKGEYLPFVNAYAGVETEKASKYTRNGAVEEQLNIHEDEKFPDPLNNFSAGISASWEIDIWKKLRNGKKAAVFEYLSSIEGKNFMVTNLVSEIANSYYELMALDNQLTIIEQSLQLQKEAQKMIRLQKEAARATQLAVSRFDAEVLKNKSSLYLIKQKIIETENKLNFLTGSYPKHIERNSDNFINIAFDTIYTGVPSQLLVNRPDIRKAEYELSAAKLNTKIARSNFYPSLDIKAGVGLSAFKPKYLTSAPESLVYSLAGDIVGPLINRNAIKAEYNTATNKQLQAIFEYEKTILNAYIEVENELSNIQNLKESFKLKEQQVNALSESIDLSIRLFKSARAEYTEVLLTQREALDAKIEIVETKRDQLLAAIKMYQALGGGWN